MDLGMRGIFGDYYGGALKSLNVLGAQKQMVLNQAEASKRAEADAQLFHSRHACQSPVATTFFRNFGEMMGRWRKGLVLEKLMGGTRPAGGLRERESAQPPGVLSYAGTPSGSVWKGCLSQVKVTICGSLKSFAGSSRVPTFSITAPGIPGARVASWVPHSGQNSRVTGLGRPHARQPG
jgi:hypothetical protein